MSFLPVWVKVSFDIFGIILLLLGMALINDGVEEKKKYPQCVSTEAWKYYTVGAFFLIIGIAIILSLEFRI